MKFTKLAIVGGVIAIASSCSNVENVDVPTSGNDSGYISLNIGLPTVESASSRADEFEAGTAEEYAVKNGRLLVFSRSANEADAKCVCVADLTGMKWGAAANGEITTSSTAVAHLQNINMADASAQYSAIAVLNYDDSFVFPSEGQTFGAWSKTAQKSSMKFVENGSTYFTMTGAPKYATSSTDPITLTDLNKSMIAQSESSLTGNAASLYVQRVVAKVLVTLKDSYTVNAGSYQGSKVVMKGWGLDITNKATYPVQVTTGLLSTYGDIWSKARFMGAENAKFRRLYWALDPNYDKAIENQATIASEFNLLTAEALATAPTAAYCLENTFDIRHQLQGQTTRVLLKAVYTPSGMTEGATFYKLGTSLLDRAGLESAIAAKAGSGAVVDLKTVATVAGNHSLSEVSVKVNGTELDANAKENLAKVLGLASASDASIGSYIGGECFYVARIKHFGDAETPWQLGDATYNDDNSKWLGRYGIVRNTVYTIDVNSVSSIGSPAVPEPDPLTPDDENDFYIQVDMNILSWAKRTHIVDL